MNVAEAFVSCPYCYVRLSQQRMTSGNTLGATVYSDGYVHYPMMLRTPRIGRCEGCRGMFMISLAVVNEDITGKYCEILEPESDDLVQWALVHRDLPYSVRREARLQAWHAAHRSERDSASPMRGLHYASNAAELQKDFKAQGHPGYVLAAEAARLMGCFGVAKRCLAEAERRAGAVALKATMQAAEPILTEELNMFCQIVAMQRAWIDAGITTVQRVMSEEAR